MEIRVFGLVSFKWIRGCRVLTVEGSCSMACQGRSKRWQGMCWRLCEMESEFEGRVDVWMQGVSGMRGVETDFRNLRMGVQFDGRKEEI